MSFSVANNANQILHSSNDGKLIKDNSSSFSKEHNEDYTSLRIIELLKNDKFMNGLDNCNNVDFANSKKLKMGEISEQEQDSKKSLNEYSNDHKSQIDPIDGFNLISDNIEVPKYDPGKDYYLEYWKTFMDIKVSREELLQWADRRNEKIREVLKIMKYYDNNYEDLKENKPNGRK